MAKPSKKSKTKKGLGKNSETVSAYTNQNFKNKWPGAEKNPPENLQELVKKGNLNLTLGEIKSEREITIISFQKREFDDDDTRLVLAVEKQFEKNSESDEIKYNYFVKTGLYAGRITCGNVVFDIRPDCNQVLFERMLDSTNHIYIDKTEDNGKYEKDHRFPLIEYLFLSSLQRVSILGLPQEYTKQKYHDIKVHGDLDVQNYIKKDIPFTGKISSQKNERHYVQSIVDVLYFAMKACKGDVEKKFKRLGLIKNELKESFSGRFPSLQTIKLAQNHRVLNNPMFADFRQTLKFAEIVIKHNTILPDALEATEKASGYLLDIASLWEAYLEDLLRRKMPNWTVFAQEELNLYQGCFFARQNYPDLVLRKKDDSKKVAILDAKFKRMQFDGGDVDRDDMFQIHSYAGYYCKKGDDVVLCGLIYPLGKEITKEELSRNKANLYGLDSSKTVFVVDGVYKGEKIKNSAEIPKNGESEVSVAEENDKNYDVVAAEKNFINRIKSILDEYVEDPKIFG